MTKIMVVDDEPDIVRLVSFTLTRRGFKVVEATDGVSAIVLAEAEQPDLILMDVMMPFMNGYEASKRLKENPKTSDIPIVMLSAKSQLVEKAAGLESGAVDYICKPFTPSELVGEVYRFIETHETGGVQ